MIVSACVVQRTSATVLSNVDALVFPACFLEVAQTRQDASSSIATFIDMRCDRALLVSSPVFATRVHPVQYTNCVSIVPTGTARRCCAVIFAGSG
jgi:hypothetical protein